MEDLGVGGTDVKESELEGVSWIDLAQVRDEWLLLWTRFGLHKMREISSLAVDLLTYQKDYSLKEVTDYRRFIIFYKCHK